MDWYVIVILSVFGTLAVVGMLWKRPKK